MSQRSKRELWETTQPRYLKSSKRGKQIKLDEFITSTWFYRKSAIRILKSGQLRSQYKRRGKKPVYLEEAVQE